jgi:hypothetical protein
VMRAKLEHLPRFSKMVHPPDSHIIGGETAQILGDVWSGDFLRHQTRFVGDDQEGTPQG